MLAVASPQIKKKRKRTTDSPLSTPPVIKKKKSLTTPISDTTKTKRKAIPDPRAVPELVLAAGELKPDIKIEIKSEVDEHVIKVEDAISTPVIKSEPVSPVKKKKKAKIKIETIETELPKPVKKKKAKIKVEIKEAVSEPEKVEVKETVIETELPLLEPAKKKKKKKSKVIEPVIESLPKVELAPPKKVKKKKKKSEAVIPAVVTPAVIIPEIKDEPLEETFQAPTAQLEAAMAELQAEDLISRDDDKVEIKDEKPSLSLFNSDIKQELLVEDHIDQHLVRSLSYTEEDPCIHHQTTEIHIALPPVYTGKIQEGIEMKMKQHSLKYMKELRGVLLKYSILSLQDTTGRYLSTRPEFHFNITCNTTSFKPSIDQILTGTVVKMGPGYVNCLVYGYFTAVVYGRFTNVMEVGSFIRFRLKHYQQTSSDDLVLKGTPEVAASS